MGDAWPRRHNIISDEAIQKSRAWKIQNLKETSEPGGN
jgi:hypothetical protein